MGWRQGIERTQTDEGEGGENKSWRAVPSKGQGKEEAKGESGNNQIVKQGGASGEKVVSSSPLSSSPKFLPHLRLFLCFSLFYTYPPQLHFQNHTLILKIHSYSLSDKWHSLGCISCLPSWLQTVKNLPAMQKTRVQSLGRKDPLEKEMATHSSILAWKIQWTEEPGGLQSMGSQRVRQD